MSGSSFLVSLSACSKKTICCWSFLSNIVGSVTLQYKEPWGDITVTVYQYQGLALIVTISNTLLKYTET